MGHPFSPLSDRMKAYDEVRKVVGRGVTSPSAVIAELRTAGLSPPARQTVSRWIHGENAPTTSMNIFVPRPSEELSFFIGALLGDGWGDVNDGGRRMLLKVRSYDFAKEFATCAAEILGKRDSYWIRRSNEKDGRWYLVKVTSVMLYEFMTGPLERLQVVAEANPVGFLRGFFTAEGCPSISVERTSRPYLGLGLVISNSDLRLLRFAASLVTSMKLRAGMIRLNRAEGVQTNLSTVRRPQYLMSISRIHDLEYFASEIGFADSEKQEKLIDALSFYREFGRHKAVNEWLRQYEKKGRKWVKRRGSLTPESNYSSALQ